MGVNADQRAAKFGGPAFALGKGAVLVALLLALCCFELWAPQAQVAAIQLIQKFQGGGVKSAAAPSSYVRSSSLNSPPRSSARLGMSTADSLMSPLPYSAASTGPAFGRSLSGPLRTPSSISSLFRGHSDLFNLVDVFSPDIGLDATDRMDESDYDSDSSRGGDDEDANLGEDFSVDLLFPEERVIEEFRKMSSFRLRRARKSDRYSIPSGPVVVAPGYGGSRLEARLTEPNRSRHTCGRSYGWFGVWINLSLIPNLDCLYYAMKLNFDPKTNTTHDSPGIEVRVIKDRIEKIETLHALPLSEFSYFAPIIKRLVSGPLGYTREMNVRGAPYDFRKAPNELHKYYFSLRKTIEQLYISNRYKKVSLICHSMGCPVMLYFLQRMPQIWKNFYIQRLISLGAPWAGSMGAVRAAFFGDNLGFSILNEKKMRELQLSLPATMFLFPKEYLYKNRTLIRTNMDPLLHSAAVPSQDYNLNDMQHLFKLADQMEFYQMYKNTQNLLGDLDPPNVEVWCLVGKGFPTLKEFHFGASFPHSPREEVYEDGDRTVSLESAAHCRTWTTKQTQPVHYKEFNTDHMGILRDQEVLKYIERILDVDFMDEVFET